MRHRAVDSEGGVKSMRVTLFHCGPAANESEQIAFKHLENRLQSTFGEDEWILLTNVAFSVTQRLQSDEIDIGVCLQLREWSTD